MPGRRQRAAVLVLLLAAAGCADRRPRLEEVAAAYTEAVQEWNAGRYLELFAPAARALAAAPAGERPDLRAALAADFDRRQHEYLAGRDAGWLEFSSDGVVLIRALNLGHGVYYETTAVERPQPDHAILVQEVRLAYMSIDVSRLPWGTTIYLLGLPLGTVYHPVIGERQAAVRQLLERLWIRWELVRQGGVWRVESLAPAAQPPLSYTDTTRF